MCVFEKKYSIKEIKDLETGANSLLYIAETRAQNKIFKTLTAGQKLWTISWLRRYSELVSNATTNTPRQRTYEF